MFGQELFICPWEAISNKEQSTLAYCIFWNAFQKIIRRMFIFCPNNYCQNVCSPNLYRYDFLKSVQFVCFGESRRSMLEVTWRPCIALFTLSAIKLRPET